MYSITLKLIIKLLIKILYIITKVSERQFNHLFNICSLSRPIIIVFVVVRNLQLDITCEPLGASCRQCNFFISPNADRFGLNILLIICLRKYQILNILFFQQDLARIHINDAETCQGIPATG